MRKRNCFADQKFVDNFFLRFGSYFWARRAIVLPRKISVKIVWIFLCWKTPLLCCIEENTVICYHSICNLIGIRWQSFVSNCCGSLTNLSDSARIQTSSDTDVINPNCRSNFYVHAYCDILSFGWSVFQSSKSHDNYIETSVVIFLNFSCYYIFQLWFHWKKYWHPLV